MQFFFSVPRVSALVEIHCLGCCDSLLICLPNDLAPTKPSSNLMTLLDTSDNSLTPVGVGTTPVTHPVFSSPSESRRVPDSIGYLMALCLGVFSSFYPEYMSPTHTSYAPPESSPPGSHLHPLVCCCRSRSSTSQWEASEPQGPVRQARRPYVAELL